MKWLLKTLGLYESFGLYLLELTLEEQDRMMTEWLDEVIPKQHVWVRYPDDTEQAGILIHQLGSYWHVRIPASGIIWVGPADHLRKRNHQ